MSSNDSLFLEAPLIFSDSSSYSLQADGKFPSNKKSSKRPRIFIGIFIILIGVAAIILYLTGLFSSSSSSSPSARFPPLSSSFPLNENLFSLFSGIFLTGPVFVDSIQLSEDLQNEILPYSPPSHDYQAGEWSNLDFQWFLLNRVIFLADSLLKYNESLTGPLPIDSQAIILQRTERISARYKKIRDQFLADPDEFAHFAPVPKYWHGTITLERFNESFAAGEILSDEGFPQVWTSTLPMEFFGPMFVAFSGELEPHFSAQSTVMNGRFIFADGLAGYWNVINNSIPFTSQGDFMFSRVSFDRPNATVQGGGFEDPDFPPPEELIASALAWLNNPSVPIKPFQRQFLIDNLIDIGEATVESYFVTLARYYSPDRSNCIAELQCQILEQPDEVRLPVRFRDQIIHYPFIYWQTPVECLNNTGDMNQLAYSINQLPDGVLLGLPSFFWSKPHGDAMRGILRRNGPNDYFLHQLITGYVEGVTEPNTMKQNVIRRVNFAEPYNFLSNETHVSLINLLGKISPDDPPRSMITGFSSSKALAIDGFLDPNWVLANGYYQSIYSNEGNIPLVRENLTQQGIIHFSKECRTTRGD